MGLAALAAAKADLNGHPTILIVALPLLVGLGLGALNGVLTVFGRVHSIVITLGMMFILQGVMLEIMDNKWLTNLSDNLRSLARGDLAQVPKRVIFGAAATVVTAILLSKMVSGRRFYALGGDRPSAELLGVNPRLVLPLAFAFSGLLVGLAGLLHASYYGQVQTTVGRGYELKAIAAAVIGGTHIMGGRGSALGILLGALLLGIITNLLVLLHIPAVWDSAVTGAVILLAVCADAFSSRREGAPCNGTPLDPLRPAGHPRRHPVNPDDRPWSHVAALPRYPQPAGSVYTPCRGRHHCHRHDVHHHDRRH
jgi:ribose/xylose/arabinose/galactoside ABC-type transport system permease subunit